MKENNEESEKKGSKAIFELNEPNTENLRQMIKLMIEEELKNINWEQAFENAINNKESKAISTDLNAPNKENLRQMIKHVIEDELNRLYFELILENTLPMKINRKKNEDESPDYHASSYYQEILNYRGTNVPGYTRPGNMMRGSLNFHRFITPEYMFDIKFGNQYHLDTEEKIDFFSMEPTFKNGRIQKRLHNIEIRKN